MKNAWRRFIYLVLILGFTLSSCSDRSSGGIVFYVSPSGNDSNSGTINDPFATLQKARDAIREIRLKKSLSSPVTVYLRNGLYELSETFVLTIEDSGTEKCPITYRAYENEKPVISGGRKINGKWEKHSGNILVTDIPEAADGKWRFRQLFMNERRLVKARIPDNNTFSIERTKEDLGKSAFKFLNGDIKRWNNLDQAK